MRRSTCLHDTELPPRDDKRTWNYSDMSRIACMSKGKRFQTTKEVRSARRELPETEMFLKSRIKYLYEKH